MSSKRFPCCLQKRTKKTGLNNENNKSTKTKENGTAVATTSSKEVDEPKKTDKEPYVPTKGEENADEISGLISLLVLLLPLRLLCGLRNSGLLCVRLIGWIGGLRGGWNIWGVVEQGTRAGYGYAGELPGSGIHARRRDKEGMRSAWRRKKIDGTG